jgi:acyl carrier protein
MTTRNDEISRKFEAVLRAHLRFLEPGAPLAAAEPLGKLGLDSMAAIDLLLDLERTFGVHIPDDLLSAETFETVASLEATFLPLLDGSAA